LNIEILHPGVSSTIQDLGRLNGLAYGVPKCGAMDPLLLKYGNALVGNPISYPGIELTISGGKFKFLNDGHCAVVGNSLSILLNGVTRLGNQKMEVKKGDVLSVGHLQTRYAYLVTQGRLEADSYWGSFSTYELVQRGGYQGRRLLKGDVLSVKKTPETVQKVNFPVKKELIRVYPGPEFNLFSAHDITHFVSEFFNVSINSNRMGYRLDGKILDSVKNLSIISAGVIPGTIQVPPSGYPIVLMADSPCTGGYPRFAVVHPEDIGSLAQILPGEDVKFIWCYDQDKEV
tara:strand:+ start:15878 stop:16741 length:864 start_codon:yes stop_codon:yes gene_type:complete